MFWGTFFPGLDGFEEARDLDVDTFHMYVPDVAAFKRLALSLGSWCCVRGRSSMLEVRMSIKWEYLKGLVPKDRVHECKLTLAAPNVCPILNGAILMFRVSRWRGTPAPQRGQSLSEISVLERRGILCGYRQGLSRRAADYLRPWPENVQIEDPDLACA